MMPKPKMFVGSSAEQIDLAHALQEGLEYVAEVTVWNQGVFSLTRSALTSLIEQLDESEFGVFVFSPDDVTKMKGSHTSTVRDNVVFELGLFIGRLGPDRCYIVAPRGNDDLHLPTDLLGITPATYEPNRQDGNLVAALGPACTRITKAMAKLKPLEKKVVDTLLVDLSSETRLTNDPDDCFVLIKSWLGGRSQAQNLSAIKFDDVDRALRLERGSAEKYIEEAAAYYGYSVGRKGKETILFEI